MLVELHKKKKKSIYSTKPVRSCALSRAFVLCQLWSLPGLTWGTGLSALQMSLCLTGFSGFSSRVINAGKSTHNEDQASCEVLTVKKKAGAITSTPNRNSAKRRSSLPNGEGLQLKENSVRPSFMLCSRVRGTCTLWPRRGMVGMEERKAMSPGLVEWQVCAQGITPSQRRWHMELGRAGVQFPGGAVVRTLSFHCWGLGFHPELGS